MDRESIAIYSMLGNALAKQQKYKNNPCDTFRDIVYF